MEQKINYITQKYFKKIADIKKTTKQGGNEESQHGIKTRY